MRDTTPIENVINNANRLAHKEQESLSVTVTLLLSNKDTGRKRQWSVEGKKPKPATPSPERNWSKLWRTMPD